MDFQDKEIDELKLLEEEKIYPPKLIIMARRTFAAEYCLMDFRFQGATEEFVKTGIPLKILEGIIQMIMILINKEMLLWHHRES